MPHEFELLKEIALDATPEQVWDAIATGPGIDSWFMGTSEIEPREGGTTRFTQAGQTMEGVVTAWEPGRHLAYRADMAERTMAFEFMIEAREQGSTVLRMVQNGFLGDNWEAEYEGLSSGWDVYLDTLGEYLTYFPGRTATPISAFGLQAADEKQAWDALTRGLGLRGIPSEGDPVHVTPEGLPAVEGAVDAVLFPNMLGIRTDDALYRFAGRGGSLGVGHHLFAPGVDRAETERAWQLWLMKLTN